MECGLGSPEAIAKCIHMAGQWLQVGRDLVGLGSLALITLLLWLFKRLRKDVGRWEKEVETEKQLRGLAEEAAKQTAHRARLAESNSANDKKALDDCKATLMKSEDELRSELTETKDKLAIINGRLNGALELTGDGTGKFWSRAVGPRLVDYERLMSSRPLSFSETRRAASANPLQRPTLPLRSQ